MRKVDIKAFCRHYNRSTPKTWDAPIVMYEILCTYNFFFYEKTGFSAE